jgi:hypothetical protein
MKMAVYDINDPTSFPEKLLIGTYYDGTEEYALRSNKMPRLYVSENELRLNPMPVWLKAELEKKKGGKR